MADSYPATGFVMPALPHRGTPHKSSKAATTMNSCHLIGYVRVSSLDQDAVLQRAALKAAGAARIFKDTASGAKDDRRGLAAALACRRAGDTLTVWKLDRLGH